MKDEKVKYFQFKKELGYPIFIRIEEEEIELKLEGLISKMGFEKVESDQLKNISFHKNQTKVLKIKKANFRVSRQIDQSHALDTYGPENLTMLGSYDVYRYKNVGMLIFGGENYFWELGLKNIDSSQDEIKVIFTRFLSWALAPMGVVGFWGVPVDDGAVVMKPKEANFESFFIDVKKMKIISVDGIKDIFAGFQLLRLDATLKNSTRIMKKEALLSFLTMNTTYFSYQGIDINLKTAIYDFSILVDGYVYPVENFKPRKVVQEAA